MLDLLRRKAQSPYLQGTVIIIVLVFVFWGVGSYQGGGRNVVATVNGEPVSFADYKRAYDVSSDRFRQQFGQDVPESMLADGSFKNRVVDEMIQRILLMQGAREMGVVVTDVELQDKIQKMESFRNNGIFDLERYRQALSSSRLSTTDFEVSVRNDLLVAKVLERLDGFVDTTPRELEDRYHYQNDAIQLGYIMLAAKGYEGKVELADEALTRFYEERAENYKTDRQIKLKYLSFPLGDLAKDIALDDGVVEAYYQRNRAQYDIPARRRARHILIRSQDGAGQNDAQRKQIEDILGRLRKGADFAALAKEFSEDGSAAGGGDLGFFSRGQMVKPFEEAVFALTPGEISEVVETRFGFHIIKLEEIQSAHLKGLEEVRPAIEEKLKREQGRNIAYKKASEAYEQIILAGSMAKYGEVTGSKVMETGFFSSPQPDESFVGKVRLLQVAFKLKKGELSSLIEGNQEYAVLFVADEKAPEVPDIALVRQRVEKDFLAQEATRLAEEDAAALLGALKGGAAPEAEAAQRGAKVEQTDYLARQAPNAKGLPWEFMSQGFGLSMVNPYPENPVVQGNNFYVFWLQEQKAAETSSLAAAQTGVQDEVLREKRQAILASWVDNLRQQATITVNQQML